MTVADELRKRDAMFPQCTNMPPWCIGCAHFDSTTSIPPDWGTCGVTGREHYKVDECDCEGFQNDERTPEERYPLYRMQLANLKYSSTAAQLKRAERAKRSVTNP